MQLLPTKQEVSDEYTALKRGAIEIEILFLTKRLEKLKMKLSLLQS